jgi:hypothetical protein
MSLSSGMPKAIASVRARPRKASVVMTSAGLPRRSSAIASWIHHDVHDPQSALPTRVMSAPAESDSMAHLEAGMGGDLVSRSTLLGGSG